MTYTDPYAEDRAAYARKALSRLVLSDTAADIADRAAALVAPDPSERTPEALEMVAAADYLVGLAEDARRAAVVHARQNGASWTDVGDQLDIAKQTAHSTYSPALARWEEALLEPYAAVGASGRGVVARLPEAALRPSETARTLDDWCARRGDGEDAVSSALPTLSTTEEMSQVLDAIRHAHTTGDTALRARTQYRKAALLERIAAESGDADASVQAAEARAYADQLAAQAETTTATGEDRS